MRFSIAILAICAVPAVFAQQYEIGVAGGGGIVRGGALTNTAGSANAGTKPGAVIGAVIGHRLYQGFTGEVRYNYIMGDLKLKSGGSEATFGAVSHAIHYDVLIHPWKQKAKTQPYLAVGGGVKVFRGTGEEHAAQALSNFAYLTRTTEWKPMISVGAGVRINVAPKVCVRIDFRDYMTSFPKELIAPAGGSTSKGWLHDFVPMIGISYLL